MAVKKDRSKRQGMTPIVILDQDSSEWSSVVRRDRKLGWDLRDNEARLE